MKHTNLFVSSAQSQNTNAPSTHIPMHVAGAGGENSKQAVVVGGGLGGLSAGIHLARQGWHVTLFEKNENCGGRMSMVNEEGFQIDMGPTLLMMPEVLYQIFESCGRKLEDYLTLHRIDPAYRVNFADGEHLEMRTNIQDLAEDAKRFAPSEAANIEKLFRAMRKQYTNARYNFIERPFVSLTSLIRPQTIAGLTQALPMTSVYKFVSKYVKDERLRQALTFQTLYLGISPMNCPSIYALLPYIEMEFGVWFPQGGMQSVARALEKLLRELGAEIHTNTPVTEITSHAGKVTGVRVLDPVLNVSRHIPCDYVLANVDTASAYSHLLKGAERKTHSDEKIAARDYGCSAYLLYLGVKDLPKNFKHHEVFLGDDYEGTLHAITRAGEFPADPALYTCIPTRTDPSLAPEGHDVLYVLVPCPHSKSKVDWAAETPAIRERVLDKLQRLGFGNIRENIVFEKQFTPLDFQDRYALYAGSAFGLAPLFTQSSVFRPRMKSEEVDGLYFAGAGTHPGGGVPIVITSGRLAAECITADHSKNRKKAYAR
jgi:phytoene desaturase